MKDAQGKPRQPGTPSSDELLRSIIESSTDFAIITQAVDGTITSWNIGAERLLGWREDEIVGLSGDVIFTSEDRAAGVPETERAATLRDSRAEDERWHERKDGSRFWGSGLLMLLGEDQDGFVKIMRDRTRQRRTEERFRKALEIETVGVIFFDAKGRITEANDAFLGMAGFTAEDVAAGLVRWDGPTPPEWLRASHQLMAELAATGRTTPQEKEFLRKDGSCWWGLFAAKLMAGGEGVGFVLDVSERRRAEGRLRESEARFRTLATNIPQLVFRTRVTGERTWGSPQWESYAGLSDAASRGFGWLEAIHPEEREATLAAWRQAEATGSFYVEHRTRRAADGEYRWHQTRAAPLPGVEARAAEWVGTSTDIHELRGLQERQQVLLAELQHRTRNLLALVQAMEQRTLRRSGSLEEFAREYESRLRALSRVQGLLAGAADEKLDLSTLVGAELRAHDTSTGEKVRIEGPRVELPMTSVQTLGLALHELATNAVKHGALREPGGRLMVTWRVERGNGQPPRLVLDWRESGVTMPADPAPRRKGYGSELIERALPYQLKAETRLEFGQDGVRCRIAVPVEAEQEVKHG